jgi:hypothetical protein
VAPTTHSDLWATSINFIFYLVSHNSSKTEADGDDGNNGTNDDNISVASDGSQ